MYCECESVGLKLTSSEYHRGNRKKSYILVYKFTTCTAFFIVPSVYSAIAIVYKSCTNICLLFISVVHPSVTYNVSTYIWFI